MTKSESSTATETPSESWTSREKIRALVGTFFLVCIALFIQIGTMAEEEAIEEDTFVRTGIKGRNKGKTCPCNEKRHEKFHGDLLNRNNLLHMVERARGSMIAKIKEDYGDYYDGIFVGEDKAYTPSSPESVDRLKRKLMIKVLRMQTEILNKDCHKCENVEEEDTFVNYVWATGGHSASAGHGNLYNESYTAYFGVDTKMVFEAIGIHFEARNHAMGATGSGLEMSMCWEQVFGSDVDFFSWDYGMVDITKLPGLMHYGYRGGLSPGRPAMIGFDVGGQEWLWTEREDQLASLGTLGMSTFVSTNLMYYTRNTGIPDSGIGVTQAEIDALPVMVRNYRCGTQYESGDPFCGEEKYSKEFCPNRMAQAGWHPGFKAHAMNGHHMALFLTQALVAAISDLVNHPVTDPSELLAELQQEEDETFENLRNGDPGERKNLLYAPDVEGDVPPVDFDTLWKGPSLCRTARMPSQTRYLGYATDSDKVGGPANEGSEEYDTCIPRWGAEDLEAGGRLMLVCGFDHEVCEGATVAPDYKDGFYAHTKYGWASLSIPNERERKAYRYDPSKIKGYIFFVFAACDWGNCEDGDMRAEHHALGNFEMKVNEQVVTELVWFSRDTIILKGEDGFNWKPDDNGVFTIAVRVKEDNASIRISSITIF